MIPPIYLFLGILAGVLLGIVISLIMRRSDSGDENVLSKIELVERAQERSERLIREEMGRGREENAKAAKIQREELRAA